MADNYGKKFEQKLKEDWLKLPNSTIDRLYDPVGGYHGIANISDFIAYCYPNIFYLECKTIKGNTFPFSNLKQYDKLCEKIGIKGVNAGVVIWFYEKDVVMYAPIEACKKMKENGEKSINCNKVLNNLYELPYNIVIIPSIKRRVFMDSDYSIFLKENI